MSAATLSAKFQISIPKDVREEMGLKPGQKFEFLRIGRTLKLVPQPRMEDLFGLGRGTKGARFGPKGPGPKADQRGQVQILSSNEKN